MIDWDDLHTFLAVNRHGNLSAAARALRVTQTTMGRRLEGLHARAGTKLLERTPSGFLLTSAGERILANVERMEAEALAVERAITGQDERLDGEVRITSVEAFAAKLIVPSLSRLAERYPGISVEIDVDTRSLSLSRREADIAVRLAAFEQHEAVVRKAGEMAFAIYASEDYLTKSGHPDFSDGAAGHRVVTLQETLLQTPEGKWFGRCVDKAHAALRTNSREGQLASVRSGLGIGCLPRYLADGEPGIVRLSAPTPEPRREIWIGVHQDTRWMPRIRAVLDHLAETLSRSAGRLCPETADVEQGSR